jgi:hypothetical protein
VTVTNPTGDQTLLHMVLRTEHHRLESVLLEASRDTSGTPGVHDDLVRHLRFSLSRHLNAEAALVRPEVDTVLEDRFAAALAEDTSNLVELFDQDPRTLDLDQMDAALHRHTDLYESLLSELRDAVGERRMATLGFEFGRVAEAAPGRPIRDDAAPAG